MLVIDVDTQASSSYCLVGDTCLDEIITGGWTIDQFINRRLVIGEPVPLDHFVRRQASNTRVPGRGALDIALIASSTNLRLSEREVLHNLTQQGASLTAIEQKLAQVLNREVARLGRDFNFIIFDCAPGISPLTTAAISCANLVVVPTIPDFISFLGRDAFLQSVTRDMTHRAAHRPPQVLITRSQARARHGVARLWNLVAGRKLETNTHKDFEEKIRSLAEQHPPSLGVFKTMLDESPVVPAAMAMGACPSHSPTYQQKYPRPPNTALKKLADEIEEALDDHP